MKNKNLLKIENVYFAFTNIAEPKFKYKSDIAKEFATTIVLSKEQAKEFKKLKLNKTVKDIPTEEFEAKFKFAPPYPEQDEQYTIGVNKAATYADGNPKPDWTYPKAFFVKDSRIVEDNDILIGNGSFGNISLEPNFNASLNSTSVTLHSVLVKQLIEFEKPRVGDEWATEGEVVLSDVARTFTSNSSSAKSSSTGEPRVNSSPSFEEDLDDLPF